jgi:DNA polymerase III delta subunit
MLVELIGPSLARLDVELGKLAAVIGFEGSIEPEHVQAMVGMSREDAAWSIQNALITGSVEAAISKLRELLKVSGHPKELVSWAVTDMLRKLHGASQMIRAGVPEAEIAKRMKLWGEAKSATLRAARTIEPDRFAQLLHAAIRNDYGVKSGLGSAERSLETLTMQIADTLGCAR